MHTFTKVSLDALLTPEDSAVLLTDHQPSQLANEMTEQFGPVMLLKATLSCSPLPSNISIASNALGAGGPFLL